MENYNARFEYKMDEKRERIVNEDLGLDTLPRMKEYCSYLPTNALLGRSKDGHILKYYHYGADADFTGMQKAFDVTAFVETCCWAIELTSMLEDALNAAEAKDNALVSFFDLSGGSLGALLGFMECGLLF